MKKEFLIDEEKDIFDGSKSTVEKKLKSRRGVCVPLRKFVTVVVSLVVMAAAAAGLAGCNNNTDKPAEVPTTKIERTIGTLEAQNYTLIASQNGKKTTSLINSDKMTTINEGFALGDYHTKENGKSFDYIYDANDGTWTKYDGQTRNFNDLIYTPLKNASWTAYDKETEVITGKMNGSEVTMKIESDGDIVLGGTNFNAEITDIGSTEVKLPGAEYIKDETTVAPIPVEEINNLINKMENNNYTYNIIESNVRYSYFMNGESVKISKDNFPISFHSVVDNTNYDYLYNNTDNKWHKTYSDKSFDFRAPIYDDLKKAVWTGYENGVYTGTFREKTVTMEIDENGTSIRGENLNIGINTFGSTIVNLPYGDSLVDETNPVINEIYTLDENRNYVYNMSSIAEVMTKWIKTDNQYGKDFLAAKNGNDGVSLNKLLFINFNKEEIELGFVADVKNSKSEYAVYKLTNKNLISLFNEGSIKTKEQLLEKLQPVVLKDITVKENIGQLDYTSDDKKSEFDVLTTKIFNRLKNKGTQLSSNEDNPNTRKDLTNANILYAFKTPNISRGVGYDLGEVVTWSQYYLLQIDGKVEMIRCNIASSYTYNSDVIGNVTNGEIGWYITSEISKTYDAQNSGIYNETTKPNEIKSSPVLYSTTNKDKEFVL